MFYAALLHDIAKPMCTILESDGRITSAGHSKKGAIDVRNMMWELNVPFQVREEICNIISVHQVPFFAFNDKGNESRPARTPEYIALQLSQDMCLRNLITVATADMKGRYCEVKQQALDDIALFTEIAHEQNCYANSYVFADDVTAYEYIKRYGTIVPNQPFYDTTKCKVYVLSGLPASGKDTFVKCHFAHLPVVSFDDARAELGIKHGDNPGQAVQLVLSRAKAHLAKGEEFVWNATHISKQMREKTLNLLDQYNAFINIHYIEQVKNITLIRNKSRDACVPNDFLVKLYHKWEIPLKTEAHLVNYHVNGATTIRDAGLFQSTISF